MHERTRGGRDFGPEECFKEFSKCVRFEIDFAVSIKTPMLSPIRDPRIKILKHYDRW